ncbi:CHAD domain-containing protein [Streptomyces thermocarboxydovorans]|uniref:CHAD domain-containing protein n=1 Tax=Streptomyces thermocarboxydovorans TaxID=59298 RepID=A0ABP3SVF2_9ACTN
MAQQHPDPTAPWDRPVPADALTGYLRARATEFLRALRRHRETGAGAAGPGGSLEAARALRRAARRISGTLHTFQPLLAPEWSESLRPELAWISSTLAHEDACAARLDRLLHALQRLSGAPVAPSQGAGAVSGRTAPVRTGPGPSGMPGSGGVRAAIPGERTTATGAAAISTGTVGTLPHASPGTRTAAAPADHLTVGAAKAGALLDRQLTLARTRAHSTALQALDSSRFHALADKVAVLASEVPLAPAAGDADLRPLAGAAEERLTDAVAALPLVTAGSPYNAEALIHGLSPDPAPHPQDTPWHQARLLLRLHRYAREVLLAAHPGGEPPAEARLRAASEALDRHRDAAEAAAAAAQAARTPRIAPATAYALGVLHADQRHEVEAARYAFQRCWQQERERKEAIGTA